nr:undecaprenyl-diphosphate phosphatase [Gemmatales bacterium]
MSWLEAIFLGIVQGVTEFLPISSSGHLVLFQSMFQWTDEESAKEWFFDGVLHLGTLLAVLIYFARELQDSFRGMMQKKAEQNTEPLWPAGIKDLLHLLILLGVASLPAALAVLLKDEQIKQSFKRPGVVAFNFLILGAILILTGFLKPGTTTGSTMRWWQAAAIGLAQGCSA